MFTKTKSVKPFSSKIEYFLFLLNEMTNYEIAVFLVNAYNLIDLMEKRNYADSGCSKELLESIMSGHSNYELLAIMKNVIIELNKDQRFNTACALLLWYHTLECYCNPELSVYGRQIWKQMQRGYPFLEYAAEELGVADFDLTACYHIPPRMK